jgi:hypothetical protein
LQLGQTQDLSGLVASKKEMSRRDLLRGNFLENGKSIIGGMRNTLFIMGEIQ